MHEFSVMCELVDKVSRELEMRGIKRVKEVWLEIGELTFLGEEQLKFSYQVLTEKNRLKDSKLVVVKKKPQIECESCGYQGNIKYENDPIYHFIAPRFSCPNCNTQVKVTQGRECRIKKIVGYV